MRTIRIYQEGNYKINDTLTLSKNASHHIGVVLRMTVNDLITLFPGDGFEYIARITEISRKATQVHIESKTAKNTESSREINLAQALSKGDRMEWVIQKSVELGVSNITPIITQHSVVRLDQERLEKKQQQWQEIAISACEQSGRVIVPTIHTPCLFINYLQTVNDNYRFILHPNNNDTWRKTTFNPGNISLLIGPEGGFSNGEVKQAGNFLFTPIGLGPRILRTETATVVALSILQMLAGDL